MTIKSREFIVHIQQREEGFFVKTVGLEIPEKPKPKPKTRDGE